MLKRQNSNHTSRQMIVPKLTFHKEDSLLPSGAIQKSSTGKTCKERTPEHSRATRTKSLDCGQRTLRQDSAKSDSFVPRRQSDSAVKPSTSLPRRQCNCEGTKLLDIRSKSGAESIISSRSEGSDCSRASNGGKNQQRKSEMIIYDGKTKKWNSLEPIHQFQSSIDRNTESSSRKIRSANSLHHNNKIKKSERWRPNGHKPNRLGHFNNNTTAEVGNKNNVEDELGEDEVKLLNIRVQSWLTGLDADASGSFMRRELATAHTETS